MTRNSDNFMSIVKVLKFVIIQREESAENFKIGTIDAIQ